MHPEARFTAQRIPQGGGKLAVAIAHRERLGLGERERVSAGAREAHPELGADADDAGAQVAELVLRGCDSPLRRRRQLDLTLHQLPLDATVADCCHDRLDARRQRESVGIEEHELLFDADCVLGAGSEAVRSHRHCLLGLNAHGLPIPALSHWI
ncbi:MAG: hypothetical protein M3Q31_17855 [Actinomycetota bacterium]|nr:hypothetical protein [Actinomycetota bacterium]